MKDSIIKTIFFFVFLIFKMERFNKNKKEESDSGRWWLFEKIENKDREEKSRLPFRRDVLAPYRQPASTFNQLNYGARTINPFNRHKKFERGSNTGPKKLEDLLKKNPEDIILSFKDPQFRIHEYLSCSEMDDALVTKVTEIMHRAFECNSIQTLMRDQIETIVESMYFSKHLYEAVNKDISLLNQVHRKSLIELTIGLCSRFLLIQPYCQAKLGPMKDRLEIVVSRRLNDTKLKSSFDVLIQFDKEATKR